MMSNNDILGLLAIASIVIPAILLAIYFDYDQKKKRTKKS